ncbi:MAG: GTPase ObgE [Nitriliruptoraceae bacterium]
MDATFVDECTVFVRGGDGGHGSVSFRREAHVPRGGPDGGDGGRGGDVVFLADEDTTSLLDLRRRPHRNAENGVHGAGNNRTGRDGETLMIRVPVGCQIYDADTNRLVADLTRHGFSFTAARGGRGGRGNLSFTNRFRRLPTFAERGEAVADRRLRLELKLIADVGLVGLPSAGKSSLIRKLSAATPRVESWPFTTLTPHLGVMRAGNAPDGTPIDVVIADVPGLIEGAAEGRGLGVTFLRHIERCAVLVHVIDAAALEADRDPLTDLRVVMHELAQHDASLLDRPALIVLNKVDVPDGRDIAAMSTDALNAAFPHLPVLLVSALTGDGIEGLRFRLGELVYADRQQRDTEEDVDDLAETTIILTPAGEDFTVEKLAAGEFLVRGARVERWVQMLPIEDHGAARYLQGRLRRAGVERALIEAGARDGDDVQIGANVFVFAPEIDDLPDEEREVILAGELDDIDDVNAAPEASRE